MSDSQGSNLTNPDFWIRLIYMLVFGLLSGLARLVVGIVAIIQAVIVLISGSPNENLKTLGEGIAEWARQCYLFLSFSSDLKPYPFQEWPVPFSKLADQDDPESSDVVDKSSEEDSQESAEGSISAEGSLSAEGSVSTEDSKSAEGSESAEKMEAREDTEAPDSADTDTKKSES